MTSILHASNDLKKKKRQSEGLRNKEIRKFGKKKTQERQLLLCFLLVPLGPPSTLSTLPSMGATDPALGTSPRRVTAPHLHLSESALPILKSHPVYAGRAFHNHPNRPFPSPPRRPPPSLFLTKLSGPLTHVLVWMSCTPTRHRALRLSPRVPSSFT